MLNPRAAALCAPLAVALLTGAPGVGVARDRHFTVVFHSATLPADARALIESTGARVISEVPEVGMMKVEGPTSLLVTLNAMPAIQAANPSIPLRLSGVASAHAIFNAPFDTSQADLYYQLQWDIKQVTNNGASFGMWSGSHQTVVGIVDTGINTQHPDLMKNFLSGSNFVPGPDGTVDPSDFEDRYGHGTYCAGAVAGNGRILGVGPNLGLKIYRVVSDTVSPFYSDWVVAGIVAAANDQVDVISMSIAWYDVIARYTWTDPDTGTVYKFRDIADFLAMKRGVNYAVKKGVFFVGTSNNNSVDMSNPAAITAAMNEIYEPLGYHIWGATLPVPARFEGVVVVNSTGPDMSLSSFSNWGAGVIDFSAPGGETSGYPDVTPSPRYWDPYYYDMCLGADLEEWGWYNWWAGVSMATPKVAAVAALVIDYAKATGQMRLSAQQVMLRLRKTAVDLGKPSYDEVYGYGMINAVSALEGK